MAVYREDIHMYKTCNPLMMSEYHRAEIDDSLQEYNQKYKSYFPTIISPEDAKLFEHPTNSDNKHQHTTAMSVINDIQDRLNTIDDMIALHNSPDRYDDEYEYNDWDREPDDPFHVIVSEYMKMSDDLRKNPDEMLTLIAWRPDTILWVDPSVYEQYPDFAIKAMERNPLVYEMLPQEIQQAPAIVDKYRDILYGQGFVQDPTCKMSAYERARENVEAMYDFANMSAVDRECLDEQEIEEEIEKEQWRVPTPAVNFRKNPACPDEMMFSKDGYEKIYGIVLTNPSAHAITEDYYGHYESTRTLQFVAACEINLSSDVCRDARINAYKANLESIKNNAAQDEYARIYLAQFCHEHGLEAQPEWQAEYDLIQRGQNPFDILELKCLEQHIDINDIRSELQWITQLPQETVQENLDWQKFGYVIGAEIAEVEYYYEQEGTLNEYTDYVRSLNLDDATIGVIVQAIEDGYNHQMREMNNYDAYNQENDHDDYGPKGPGEE